MNLQRSFLLFLIITMLGLCSCQEVCLTLPKTSSVQGGNNQVGRPGKMGPKGVKGEQGACGECQCSDNHDALQILTNQLNLLRELVIENHSMDGFDKVKYCAAGLKDGSILNEQFNASQYWRNDPGHRPQWARLDNVPVPGVHIGAWATTSVDGAGEWIQVDFRQPTYLTGIVTQGRPSTYYRAQWVHEFKIAHGNEENYLNIIKNQNGEELVFQGNWDNNSYMINMFPNPIKSRFVRLIIVRSLGGLLRMEYLNC